MLEQDVFPATDPQNSRYARFMARGWESKSIEAQQEEASRGRKAVPAMSEDERRTRERRRTLELARARAADDLSRATVASHRQMLEQALAALDEQLRQLTAAGNSRT